MVKRILIVILIVLSLSLLLSIESDATGEDDLKEIKIGNCTILFDDEYLYVTCITFDTDENILETYLLNDLTDGTTKDHYGAINIFASTRSSHCVAMLNDEIYGGTSIELDSSVTESIDANKTILTVKKFQHLITFGTGESEELNITEPSTIKNINAYLGDSIIIPNVPSGYIKRGYVANLWNTAENGKGSDINPGETIVNEALLNKLCSGKCSDSSCEVVLYPKFEKVQYDIKYDSNGGQVDEEIAETVMKIDETITVTDIIPQKKDSIFKYWKIGNSLVNANENYTLKREDIPLKSNVITITAQWAANITHNLTNCSLSSTYTYADYGKEWSATITPDEHYKLPTSVASDCFVYSLNSDGTALISVSNVTKAIDISITAEPIEHVITLDSDGGVFEGSNTITVNEVYNVTLPKPTKARHVFNGWFDDTTEITETKSLTSDKTLKASWTKTVFLVRFLDAPDGTVLSSCETSGSVTEPSEKPTKLGNTFVKWTSSTAGDFTSTVTDDTDYYPVWSVNKVRFYLDEGAESYEEYETLKLTELPIPPTRDDWRFDYWYYYSDGAETKYAVDNKDNNNVYAKWTKIIFQVNFYSDDDGEVISGCKTTGPITEPTEKPSKLGYTFVKWTSSTGDFTGTVTDDTDYYPVWSVNIVKFYLDEGAEPYKEYETLKLTELPIPPTRDDWRFDYWYYYSDGTETEYTLDNKDSNDVYAKWTKIRFQVNFYNDVDGKIISGLKTTGSVTVLPTEPTKEGYAFIRWITSSNKEFTGTVTEDTDYYPDWREVHTISFFLNEADEKPYLEYDAYLMSNLPTPERYGWKFNYWYYYADDGTQKTLIGDIGKDVSAYASWTQTLFNVRFFSDTGGTVIHTCECKADEFFYKPTDNPTKTGYSFVRWISSDGEYNGGVTKDTDYYPEWKENIIRFYLREGETSYEEYKGPELTTLPKPVAEYGWKFNCWYYKSDDIETEFTGDIGRDVDVYGSWTKIIFKVRFLYDSEGDVFEEYETSGTVTVPETNPSRTGYSFVRWTSSNGELKTTVTDDTDFCAEWVAHTIRFYLNEGDEKPYDECEIPSMTELPKPTKDRYEFDHWYYKSGDEKIKYTEDIGKDVDVYAEWIKVIFIVRFLCDPEGIVLKECETTGNVTVPETNPSRTGYSFVKWTSSTAGDFTGKVTDDTDYCAVWVAHKIRFYLNEGDEKPYDECEIPSMTELPKPTKDRYEFDHWYYKSDDIKIEFTEDIGKDVDVYASWIKTVFHVRFLDDYEGNVISEYDTTGTITIPSTIPTKTGYSFMYWTSLNGKLTSTATDDIDYFPMWDVHIITFHLYENVSGYYECEVASLTELPNPVPPYGYKFGYWYYKSGDERIEFKDDIGKSVDVYALWIKTIFDVRFIVKDPDNSSHDYVTVYECESTGEVATPSVIPTKKCYSFTHWATVDGEVFTGTVTGDTDYYAVWTENVIKFYLDEGGKVYCESKVLSFNEMPTPPSRDDWGFDYWYYYLDDKKTKFTFGIMDNTNVYAKWTKMRFQVNFYDDEGNIISECKTEGTVTAPAAPEKTGYAFIRWITSSNKEFTGTVTEDTDYHPDWRKIHTVSFYLSENDAEAHLECDAYQMNLPTPERYGWKFDYWYYYDNGTKKTFIGDIGKDVSVYAKWTQTIFNVRFLDDTGKVIHTCECEAGGYFDKPAVNPTKTGYSFVCWMSSDGEYNGSVTKDTDYKPEWEENVIRFYLREGENPYYECKGPELTIPSDPEAEYGWKFGYWYYVADGVENTFTGDIGRDIDVYVKWIKTIFKVRFLYESGGDVFKEYETTGIVTVPDTDPSKTGYSFVSWTSSDGGLKTTVTDDADFYAEWVAHKIRFYLNEGDKTAYDECEIPTMIELPTPDSTERWEFSYWYYKSGDEKIKYTEDIGSDVDVYGSWKKILFYVEFLDQSGNRVDYRETTGTITDKIKVPVRAGYTFVKWTSSAAGDYTGTITDDTVYYADWSVNVIKFYLDEGEKLFKAYNAPDLDKIPTPPSRDGWNFSHWYYKSGDEKIPYLIDNLNSIDVYALWVKTEFQVNFYKDDTKSELVSEYKTTGEVVPPTTVPTKEGYVFTRWITFSNEELTGTVSEDTDYHPDWKRVYTIKLYLDTDGTLFKEYNSSNLPSPIPEPTSLDGRIFVRWYYMNGNSETEFVRDIGRDVDVYASWKEATPSSEKSSGSSGSSSGNTSGSTSGGTSSSGSGTSGSASSGNSGSSSSGSSTSSGSSGSSATPSGGGSSSTPSSGGSITPTPVTDPETEDTEITDETEDPTEEKEPETKVYEHRFYIDDTGRIWRIGDPSGISETPTRDGYTFGGWYILIDGERIPYTEGLNIDTNVYAIWNIVKTDGDGNPMIPAAAIASVLAVVLIVLVTGRKIN